MLAATTATAESTHNQTHFLPRRDSLPRAKPVIELSLTHGGEEEDASGRGRPGQPDPQDAQVGEAKLPKVTGFLLGGVLLVSDLLCCYFFDTGVCAEKKRVKKKKIAPHPSSSGLHTAGHTKKAEEQQQQRGEPTSRIIMCIEVFAAFIHEFEHAPRLHPVLSSPLLPPDPQCDSCALAKRKCDGKSTCSLCLKRASPCVYSEVS